MKVEVRTEVESSILDVPYSILDMLNRLDNHEHPRKMLRLPTKSRNFAIYNGVPIQ